MPTGKQIRAARALLDWDAADLAARVGIRRETVLSVENGLAVPRAATMDKIIHAFNDAGVDFLDNSGVRNKLKNFEVLEGHSGFTRFYEIVFDHISKRGGDICVGGVDEKLFSKYRPNAEAHREQMAKLIKKGVAFNMRIIVREGDYNFTATKYAAYRWAPKEYFSPTSFYVFGDYLALISFEADPAPLVLLMQAGSFAEAYRQSFNFAWVNSIDPPPKNATRNKI